MQRVVLFLAVILPIIYSQSCEGTWSDWTVSVACNKTCGMCGFETQTRTCQPADCTCEGDNTQTIACGSAVCFYPDPTCCPGYKKALVGGKFVCVPI